MNANQTVFELISQFRTELSQNGTIDLFYLWLEAEYRHIREKDWVWNWTRTSRLTFAPEDEPAGLFSWVEGTNYMTLTVPLTLGYRMTGRKVKLGDEWYKIINYGLGTVNRVTLDREVAGSAIGIVPTAVPFVRDEYVFPTGLIRTVEVAGSKIGMYSEYKIRRGFFDVTQMNPEPGTPFSYIASDSARLAPPAFAPTVTDSGSGAFTAGVYYYFYTRYDPESRLESPPGPATTYVAMPGGFAPNVVYANPVTSDQLEGTSHSLRLWRSDVDPGRLRPGMYLLTTRDASVPGTPFKDTNRTVRGLDRLHDGLSTSIQLWPPPDDTRRTLRVEHVYNWHGRPDDDDQIDMGRDDAVAELLRLYFVGVVGLQRNDATQQRQASMQLRAQVNYLLTASRESSKADAGAGTHIQYTPGGAGYTTRQDIISGDWVNRLRGEE